MGHYWRSLQYNDSETEVDCGTFLAVCDSKPQDCAVLIEQLGGAYADEGNSTYSSIPFRGTWLEVTVPVAVHGKQLGRTQHT